MDNETKEMMDTLWPLFSKINIFGSIIICIFGIIGNLLSLKVFSSTKIPRTSSRIYLCALCITDSVFLLTHFMDNTLRELVDHFHIEYPINIVDQKESMCRLFTLLRSSCKCASIFFIVFFTVRKEIILK